MSIIKEYEVHENFGCYCIEVDPRETPNQCSKFPSTDRTNLEMNFSSLSMLLMGYPCI